MTAAFCKVKIQVAEAKQSAAASGLQLTKVLAAPWIAHLRSEIHSNLILRRS